MKKLLFTALVVITAQSQAEESKLSISVYNSYGISSRTPIQKMSPTEISNTDALHGVIETAAGLSSEERNQYLADQCAGKSLREKAEMARHLSDLAGDIYDFSRAGSGDDEAARVSYVSTEDQWQAIGNHLDPEKENTKAGVCRDMALTVSNFLLTCGVPKECVSIESYRTAAGGHQVVQAGCSDEIHTINWSELYNTNGQDYTNFNLIPNLPNTGINHTKFDPETGELLEVRQTELGIVLATVAGGYVDDPFYQPELLMLEAQYSVLTGGLFKARLQSGSEMTGVKIALDSYFTKWVHLQTGFVYAKNSPTEDSYNDVEQEILYLTYRGDINLPKFRIYESENSVVEFSNQLYVHGEQAIFKNTSESLSISGDAGKNDQGSLYTGHDSSIAYQDGNSKFYLGVENKWVYERQTNTQVENPEGLTVKDNVGYDFSKARSTIYAGANYNSDHAINYSAQISHAKRPLSTSNKVSLGIEFTQADIATYLSHEVFTMNSGQKYSVYDASVLKRINSSVGRFELSAQGKYTPEGVDTVKGGINLRYVPGAR